MKMGRRCKQLKSCFRWRCWPLCWSA